MLQSRPFPYLPIPGYNCTGPPLTQGEIADIEEELISFTAPSLTREQVDVLDSDLRDQLIQLALGEHSSQASLRTPIRESPPRTIESTTTTTVRAWLVPIDGPRNPQDTDTITRDDSSMADSADENPWFPGHRLGDSPRYDLDDAQ